MEAEMKFHLKEVRSDEGAFITIENGVFAEGSPDHLMAYALTSELN